MIRVATRGSLLARTQTQGVADAITAATGRECKLVTIRTAGDDVRKRLGTGAPGVFTSALRDALKAGEVDVAVHSFKDLPSAPEPGLVVIAVPPRANPLDAVVANTDLAGLASGARVGTSSPRRAAALRRMRGDLEIVPIRGNLDSRIRQVVEGSVDAIIVAAAGLERIGRLDEAVQLMDPAVMLPAPAQGALAVECRADDPLATELAALDDLPSRLTVTAERAVLRGIQAACTTAVGAYALIDGALLDGGLIDGDRLTLEAEITNHAGVGYARASGTASADLIEAEGLGLAVAAELLSFGDAE